MASSSVTLTPLRYAFSSRVQVFATKDGKSIELQASDHLRLKELKDVLENEMETNADTIAVHLKWSHEKEMGDYVRVIEKDLNQKKRKGTDTDSDTAQKFQKS